MAKTITVTTVTITHHYDNDPSYAEVHVGATTEDAKAKALASLQVYLDDYFDGFDENPVENATSLADLVHWANDECASEWFEQDVQSHEVTI